MLWMMHDECTKWEFLKNAYVLRKLYNSFIKTLIQSSKLFFFFFMWLVGWVGGLKLMFVSLMKRNGKESYCRSCTFTARLTIVCGHLHPVFLLCFCCVSAVSVLLAVICFLSVSFFAFPHCISFSFSSCFLLFFPPLSSLYTIHLDHLSLHMPYSVLLHHNKQLLPKKTITKQIVFYPFVID